MQTSDKAILPSWLSAEGAFDVGIGRGIGETVGERSMSSSSFVIFFRDEGSK